MSLSPSMAGVAAHTSLVLRSRFGFAPVPTSKQFSRYLLRAHSSKNSSENDPTPRSSRDSDPSSRPKEFRGFGAPLPKDQNKAEALRESLAGVSNAKGRRPKGTNVIMGNADTEEQWRELDAQVNEYPGQRVFKAIGMGGDDFVVSMTSCVEDVVGNVHEECISTRLSAGGKYISATIGPVWVENPDQVLEIYAKMKSDERLRYFL